MTETEFYLQTSQGMNVWRKHMTSWEEGWTAVGSGKDLRITLTVDKIMMQEKEEDQI